MAWFLFFRSVGLTPADLYLVPTPRDERRTEPHNGLWETSRLGRNTRTSTAGLPRGQGDCAEDCAVKGSDLSLRRAGPEGVQRFREAHSVGRCSRRSGLRAWRLRSR